MTAPDVPEIVLSAPTPEKLRQLQLRLLSARSDPDRAADAARALVVAEELHGFLTEMASTLDARGYSHMASLLDIGAVGAAALESLVSPGETSFGQVALAAMSAGLVVAATRQHVTAWSRELEVPLTRGVWFLQHELWWLSEAGQPDVDHDARAGAITELLAPILNEELPSEARLALLGRILQLVLLVHTARALGNVAVDG